MAKSDNPYKRLMKSASILGTDSIWLGPDHLLYVENRGYTEYYRRFYFKDIQAVICRRNQARAVFNAMFGIIFLSLFAIWAITQTTFMAWVAGGYLALYAIILITNGVLGPTCECHIRTAVQKRKIRPVGRYRSYFKFINRIQPLIEEAQGTWDAEDIRSRYQEWLAQARQSTAAPEAAFPRPAEPPSKPSPPPLRPISDTPPVAKKPFRSYSHHLLFSAMTVYGLIKAGEIMFNNIALQAADMAVMAVLVVSSIWSVISQYQTTLKKDLQHLAWAVLIYVYLAALILLLIPAITAPTFPGNISELLSLLASYELRSSGIVMSAYFVFGVIAFTIGIYGFIGIGHVSLKQRAPSDTGSNAENADESTAQDSAESQARSGE